MAKKFGNYYLTRNNPRELLKENRKYKDVIYNIQKEINKIYIDGETINRALLLSIYERIYNLLKEVE